MIDTPNYLESINEQRRLLTNVLIVVVLVLDTIWALVYSFTHFYADSATGMGIFLSSIFIPKATYTIVGCIFLYCGVALLLNKNKRLPLPKVQAAILIISLILLVLMSDDQSEIVAGTTSFILLAPVFLAAELIGPAAGIVTVIIEFLFIVLISLQTPGLTINSFSLTVIWFLALTAYINAQKKINSTMIAYREAEKNLAVLKSMADGVLVFNNQGECTQSNASADRILEGKSKSALFHQAQQLTGPTKIIQWTPTKTIAVTLSTLRNEKGESEGTVASIRDYTTETIVSKVKTSILGIVSHELRTPASAIKGYVDLMMMAPGDPEVQDQARAAILANTRRLLLLIGDLVDNASLEAGTLSIQLSDVNIRSVIDELVSLQINSITNQNLELVAAVESNVPEIIKTDRGRLLQICQNLLINAIKFTEKGKVEIHTWVENPNLIIAISDTGMGIPAENIPFIFEPLRRLPDYATRKHQGAGLGLSIAKKLTELLKGEISVTSTPDVGSIFTIKLPL